MAEKPAGCCGGSCSDPSSPIVDIESLDTLHCADPNYWSKTSNEKEWLSANEKSTVERFMSENEEKDVDEMEWTSISASAIKVTLASFWTYYIIGFIFNDVPIQW